jgi:hypothetical protein
MNDSSFFNLGVKLAAAARGRDPQNLVTISGLVSTIDNPKEANYGFVQKIMCKVAAQAFEEAGRKNEMEYHIFDKLAHTSAWYPEFDTYSNAALFALGKIVTEKEQQIKEASNEEITKQAQNLLPGLIAMSAKSAPEAVKVIAGAGALGGGITGGLYWLLNRHAQEDEDEAEVIKAKVDYYNKISDEIKRQLGTQKLPPAQIASMVQDIADRENLF